MSAFDPRGNAGPAADHLNRILEQLGSDDLWKLRTLALMERLTGVLVTRDFLNAAAFRFAPAASSPRWPRRRSPAYAAEQNDDD